MNSLFIRGKYICRIYASTFHCYLYCESNFQLLDDKAELILGCGIAGFTHNLLLWPQISNCLRRNYAKRRKLAHCGSFCVYLGLFKPPANFVCFRHFQSVSSCESLSRLNLGQLYWLIGSHDTIHLKMALKTILIFLWEVFHFR